MIKKFLNKFSNKENNTISKDDALSKEKIQWQVKKDQDLALKIQEKEITRLRINRVSYSRSERFAKPN